MSHSHDHEHDHHHEGPPAPGTVDWRLNGVRVIKGDQLDTNTAQTPGMNRAAAINKAAAWAPKNLGWHGQYSRAKCQNRRTSSWRA